MNDQQNGDDDVHQRAGDGDEEFLPRLLRNALELGDAADRQQRHIRRRHAEGAGGEDVAELVQQHAQEQQHHESETVPGGGGAALGIAGGEDPGEKQQEGQVDAHHRARHFADIQRPGHECLVWSGSPP